MRSFLKNVFSESSLSITHGFGYSEITRIRILDDDIIQAIGIKGKTIPWIFVQVVDEP
jgi:hypothetical protein